MTENIKIPERRYLKGIRDSLSDNFPLTCNVCNTVYFNEEDYTRRTTEIKRVGIDYSLDEIKSSKEDSPYSDFGFIFSRNCRCNTTFTLVIDPSKLSPMEYAEFIEDLRSKAEKKVAQLFLETVRKNVLKKKSGLHEKIEDVNISQGEVYKQALLDFRDEYNSYVLGNLDI